jgi:hypothetical protein
LQTGDDEAIENEEAGYHLIGPPHEELDQKHFAEISADLPKYR